MIRLKVIGEDESAEVLEETKTVVSAAARAFEKTAEHLATAVKESAKAFDAINKRLGEIEANKAPAQIKGPRGDMENFSFARWLLAKHEEVTTGKSTSYTAPYETAYYKAQSELNGQDGGFLAPEEWRNEYFKVLRGGLILNKLPINIFQTKARVSRIPWGVDDWQWNYLGDNAAATSSDRHVQSITFTPRKAIALSTIPNELIRDAADIADQWLQKDAASSAAHEIDKQALFGDGQAGRPVGLINQSFVNGLTLLNDTGNGATPTYNDITNGIGSVAILGNTALVTGGAAECNGVVANPRFGQTLDNIMSPAGIPLWQYGLSNNIDLPQAHRWLGVENWVLSALVPAGITKGSSSDCSYLIFGDWRNFFLMMREDFEFSISDRPKAASDQSLVKVLIRYDTHTIFPFAFAVLSGVRA